MPAAVMGGRARRPRGPALTCGGCCVERNPMRRCAHGDRWLHRLGVLRQQLPPSPAAAAAAPAASAQRQQHASISSTAAAAAPAAAAAAPPLGIDPVPLQGQVAMVTGGGRGIGAAISQLLAVRGAKIAVLYRSDADAAEATIATLPGEGHRAFQCDVADAAAVEAVVATTVAEMGRIDIAVNNAGIYVDHDINDVDGTSFADWQAAWDDIISANLTGPSNVCFCVGRWMAAHGVKGRIVNVSSRGAFRGEPTAPAYGASKAALNSMSQSLAKALGPDGAGNVCLEPFLYSKSIDLPRQARDKHRGS
jgi:3-oxoacyl-[acyl-carrier protein] reductase